VTQDTPVSAVVPPKTPDFNLHDLFLGSHTALGAPEPTAPAPGTFHVIQGSLLEKAIQKFNPSFHGGVTKDENQNYLDSRPIVQPVVDAAQFIDKDKHPVAKALAEVSQSLTSPANIAIMSSTGGLGLVDNPVAMQFASRLLSGGFSAQAIGDAYAHSKAFKDAVDKGDWNEAEYQITHAVASGTLGILAGRDAATSKPIQGNPAASPRDMLAPRVNPFRALKQDVNPSTEVAGETFSTRPLRSGVNQDAATQAVQNIADQTTLAAGAVPTGQTTSLRDVFQEPIAAREAVAKTFYKALDDASDNEWTANQNALKNVRKEIQMKSGLNEETDVKLNAAKTRLEWQEEQIIDQAVKNGMPADVAQQARTNWIQKSRLEDIQDIFNKKSNISGLRPEMAKPGVKGLPQEQYNFKGIAKDLNAMDPNDLNTALGKDRAQSLLAAVNLAAKQGWASGKAVAAIRTALQLTGLGHIGAVSHLIQ
jgi:hypothetical protein